QEYGGGYGAVNGPGGNNYFNMQDINQDGELERVAPYNQYGGWGAAYDPNLLVYQWDSFHPQSPNFQVPTPWVAPENGPIELFRNTLTFSNTVSLAGNTESGNYRLSYSKFLQEGIIPNS